MVTLIPVINRTNDAERNLTTWAGVMAADRL
jgi:hypothetical protein